MGQAKTTDRAAGIGMSPKENEMLDDAEKRPLHYQRPLRAVSTRNTFKVRRWLAMGGPILVMLFSLQFLGGAGLLGAAMWRNEKARTAAVCIAVGLFALLGLGLLVFGVRYLRKAFQYDAVALEGSTLILLR